MKVLAYLLLLLICLIFPQGVLAASQIPPDFNLIRSSVGVQLYRKEYRNGYPDYVQVIRLDRGAEVRLLHGKVDFQGTQAGVYGGLDVRFTSRSIIQYWEQIFSSTWRAFCVTNGQFFYMYEYPTRLPFPLKVDGRVVSGGYSKGEFTDQKLMLEIWKDYADIRPLTKLNFQNSDAPNIVGGLTEDARKSPEKVVGRTFVGVADQNEDGVYETLLIYSTQAARQREAADTLRQFGAQKVMMLDGGLSTQLVCQGKPYIQTERSVPQAIAVLDGTKPFRPRPPAQPIPIRPKQEMSQGETPIEGSAVSPTPVAHSSEQVTAATLLNHSGDEGSMGSSIRIRDVLFVPVPIFLISMGLLGILRRLWGR